MTFSRLRGLLPLGVLRCLASPLKTRLLSLLGPGIPGKQSVLAQYRLKALIRPYQGTSNAMRNSATLPRYAATSHLNRSVILAGTITSQERLHYRLAMLNTGEQLLIGHAIYNDGAITR